MKHAYWRILCVILIVGLWGCTEGPVQEMDDTSAFNARLADPCGELAAEEVLHELVPGSLDAIYAGIALEIPGFAGIHKTRGRTVVSLVDPEKNERTLRSRLARAYPATGYFFDDIREGSYDVQPARYDFFTLGAWKLHANALFAERLITWLDADEKANLIRVGVRDARQIETVRRRLLKDDCIEEAVLDIAVAFEIYEPGDDVVGTSHLELIDQVLPIAGGLQVQETLGVDSPCTAGFITDAETVNGTKAVLIVNSHCSLTEDAPDDPDLSLMSQPDPSASLIGSESSDVMMSPSVTGCPAGASCRFSDSALYEVTDPDVTYYKKTIYRTTGENNGSIEIDEFPDETLRTFIINGNVMDPGAGAEVHKVGRTTGWTSGETTFTCVNTSEQNGTEVHLLQHLATYNSDQGDSGSPVFLFPDDIVQQSVIISGIHWGRYTYNGTEYRIYSGMHNIQNDHAGYGTLDF